MALSLVTVRARTRGKGPQLFSYQGVGKLTAREVLSQEKEQKKNKAGELVFDENKKPVMVQAPIYNEDGSVLMIDDVDASGIVDAAQPEALDETVNLFAQIPARNEKDTPLQRMLDGALNWYNVLARKAASPVIEQEDKVDELTPIVAELIAAGLLTEENEGAWRRATTLGANSTDTPRLEYVKLMKEYKKLQALKA